MTQTSKQIGIGRPSFLSEQQKSEIYAAALRILADIGMRLHHDEAQTIMLAAGCSLDDDGRVHVPATLVDRARGTAPASVTMYDRNGEPAMELGGANAYFGTGSDLMHLYDLESGERRDATLADVATAARLCDALPDIDFVMSCAYPHEIDPHRAYVEELRVMVANTIKPLVMTGEGLADMTVMRDVAAALRGGHEELRAKPYFVVYNEPSSPLDHPTDSIDKLLFCADTGIPSIYSAGAAGRRHGAHHHCRATSPRALPSRSSASCCTSSAGRARRSCSAWGRRCSTWPPRQSSYNAPEYLHSYACIVEMAKWLDLPNWGYGGTSDAQLVDAQAGMEVAELTLLSCCWLEPQPRRRLPRLRPHRLARADRHHDEFSP